VGFAELFGLLFLLLAVALFVALKMCLPFSPAKDFFSKACFTISLFLRFSSFFS
jgi:hypothetical protein